MSDSFNAGRGLKSTFSGKTARNDVTGALIKHTPTKKFSNNYDAIFGAKRRELGLDKDTECTTN
jgi:hypothetical protein